MPLPKYFGSERWIPIPKFLVMVEGSETDLAGADVETLRNIIRRKEEEVGRWKDNVQELEKHLKDSAIANSDLEVELRRLQRQKSTLDSEHRQTLGQLEKVQAAEKNHRAKYKEIVERYNNLLSKHKLLRIECQEVTTVNRNQEREIETLRGTNLKISAESKTLVEQLNIFTGDIARQNQRVNTSAIRDDEYFTSEFANLAGEIRNWSFTHFFPPSETSVPEVVTGALQDAISRISTGTNLPEIFKNRVMSRRVVAGLLANELIDRFFDPPMLGLMPKLFCELESMVEKTGCQKSPWLSQTISLLVKSEQFERGFGEKVRTLYKDLCELLGELAPQESGGSKASKRNQKLQAIVDRAANLAVEISQQPYWYHLVTVTPGDRFSPYYMEDVGREVWREEDDPGTCESNFPVSLSVFPCVYRRDPIEGGEPEGVIINHAWVTVEMGDARAGAEQGDGDMANQEAKRGVEVGGGVSERAR